MNLKSLAQKIEQKIAASSDLELALQEYDAEMGQLAIDCVKNTKIAEASIFETILNKAKDIAQRPYANTGALSAITGLGGAAAGGLLSGNLVSKKELESESDFRKRKRDTAIIGALAGGALGAGTPGILGAAGALGSKPVIPTLKDKIKENVFTPEIGLTAAGAGTGIAARNWWAKLNAKALESLKNISGPAAAEATTAHKNLVGALGGKVGPNPFVPTKLVPGTSVNFYADLINKYPRVSSLLGSRPFIPSARMGAPLIGAVLGNQLANYLESE